MMKIVTDDLVRIDGDFESGCLGQVTRLGEDWYDLQLRPDTWYWLHFRVRGAKGRQIIFEFTTRNIDNPNYDYGRNRWILPRVNPQHSDAEKGRGDPETTGPDYLVRPVVSDNGSDWRPVDEIEQAGSLPGRFRITHRFTSDEAYICYSQPYTYSMMLQWIEELKGDSRVAIGSIGTSRVGVEQPLLTIGANPSCRDLVALISREDADESPGSWGLEGLVRELLDGRNKSLLDRYVFKIVPMVCVDGVIAGATHSAGYDYGGKRWHHEPTAKEIQNVKEAMRGWVADGFKLRLAGKIHGGQSLKPTAALAVAANDVVAGDEALWQVLTSHTSEFWQPKTFLAGKAQIRPAGYFERFVLDEFGVSVVFGTHIQGHSPDGARQCGAGLMQAMAAFLSVSA